MRRAARRDLNERAIVMALEKAGCSVIRISQPGVPDLLVGRYGRNMLLEVKSRDGTLTEDQEQWHARWRGQVAIVRDELEALRVVGVIR